MTKHLLMYFSLIWATLVQAAPPVVKERIDTQVGQMVKITIKLDTPPDPTDPKKLLPPVEVGYTQSFSEDQAFFEELVSKSGERRFVFQSLKPGYYVLAFWSKGELTGVMTLINVTQPDPAPPVTTPPGTTPPTLPIGTVNYLLVVRKDTTGGADPAFTKIMQNPAWNELTKKGIKYKDKTASEAKAMGFNVPATLPVVFSLYDSGTKSKIIGEPVPLTTNTDILKLVP